MNPEVNANSGTDCDLSWKTVVSLKDEVPAGFTDKRHSHHRGQLLYARSGVMSVKTEHSTFAIPPQRALWIDAGVEHEVSCRSNVSLRTLYFDPCLVNNTGAPCHLIEVSQFLKALILEVVNFDTARDMDERQKLIIRLLLQEIWYMPGAPYKIEIPRNKRLRLACLAVIENPAAKAGLDELAEIACVSRRAFTRLFRQETGSSFGDWRRLVRLVEALTLLEAGNSATATAYDVGYSSLSAFSAAFRREFGVTPSSYHEP